jgi:RimJ/RimL family protein N-acetyltransferase
MPAPPAWKGAPVPDTITLAGRHIRLELLDRRHADELQTAGQRADIWTFMTEPRGPFDDAGDAAEWIDHALQEFTAGARLPFAVILQATGQAIGSTSYYFEARWPNRTLEIGASWLFPGYWRTAVNTEAKYLLLREAFETLKAERVEFMTDARNIRSQRAIQRIGASKEGVLRAHMICPDGHRRDSVYFSILSREWVGVKGRLQALLKG